MNPLSRNLRQMDKQAAIDVGVANGHVLQDAPGKHRYGVVWRCIRCNEEATYANGELIESLIEEPCNGAPLMRDAIVEAFDIPPVPVVHETPAPAPVSEVPETPTLPDETIPVKKPRARKPAVPEL